MRFFDRLAETEELDQLVADVAAGRSRVAVLRGEAGIGKTALLQRLTEGLSGWFVVATAAVESEIELAYGSLHQLCTPMLDRLERLPPNQHDALATVFGRRAGPAPDGFLVGLATLSLFAEVAERQPLLCIVDDAQWLDAASALALGFVARRLTAERVGLVCAARTGVGDSVLLGLPELPIHGLSSSDARALLLENVHGPVDPAVLDRIVIESHGNPLALLELPRSWNGPEIAGGFALPEGPIAGKIEHSYARRLAQLPSATRLLVLTAAAEPLGDGALLERAVKGLGLDVAAADAAVDAGLLRLTDSVEFAHPLARSATYRSATVGDRRRVHKALADATDPHIDPDRFAWHRACAASGPDQALATELEQAAIRTQARAGIAAAAALLQHAAALTPDASRRAERALAAAEASFHAGRLDTALALVAVAEAVPIDELQRARAELVRGYVALASGAAGDGAVLLLRAAKRQERLDFETARETYVAAIGAAITGASDAALLEICRAVRSSRLPAESERPLHVLLDGLALLFTDGHAAAAPALQHAAKTLRATSTEEVLRWGWVATGASAATWDFESFAEISARQVQVVREAGALAQLPLHLAQLAMARAWEGELSAATLLAEESDDVAAAIGTSFVPYARLRVHALQAGDRGALEAMVAEIAKTTRVQAGVAHAHWAAAVLYNGLTQFDDARAAAERAASDAFDPWTRAFALPELVEAAARGGDTDAARNALERLAATTQPAGTDWALGIEARCRALVSEGDAADELYRHAIERLARTRLRPELARARMLYGEWLRREGRRRDARKELNAAYEIFESVGMAAFAERVRRGQIATGEAARRRVDETRGELTPQEEQIARLARDGLSNHEIGAQLFISARTVEWHLRNVFAKLGISNRQQLHAALTPRSGP